MSEPYTPDTETVREQYTREQPPHIGTVSSKCAEFDRWLAGAKADAWDEGEQAGMRRADWEYGATPNVPKSNPYRQEADR